jgi:hypothetical protein
MKNTLKKVVQKTLLGAALVAGTLGLGATQAQAAVRVFVGGRVAYVPPCPGPGYAWVAGYYNGGVWVPGFWRAPRVGVVYGPGFYHGYYYHPYRHYGWYRRY